MMKLTEFPALDENVLVYNPALVREELDKVWTAVIENPATMYWLETPYPEVAVSLMPQRWQDPFQVGGGIPSNIALGVPIHNERGFVAVERLRYIRTKELFISLYTLDLPEPLLIYMLRLWRCKHCGRRGSGPRPEICPSGTICLSEPMGPQIGLIFDKTSNREDEKREALAKMAKEYGQRYVRDKA